jgi:hypothetical protein
MYTAYRTDIGVAKDMSLLRILQVNLIDVLDLLLSCCTISLRNAIKARHTV